jgi:hypothetical protein
MKNNTRVERFSANVRPDRMAFPYAPRSNGDAPVPTLEDRLDAALRELATLKGQGATPTRAERIMAAKRELATIQGNLATLRNTVDAAEARSRAETLPSRGNGFAVYSDTFLERANGRDEDPFTRSQREAAGAWHRGRAPLEGPEARSNRAEELEDPFTRSQREAAGAWHRGRAA